MLTIVVPFVVVLSSLLAFYWLLVLRPETAEHDALTKRLVQSAPAASKTGPTALVKSREVLSAIPMLDRALRASQRLIAPIQQQLTIAHLKITPATLLLACGCVAVGTFTLVVLTIHQRWLALLLACLTAYLPIAYVRMRASKRLILLEEQFPEATDLIARALRAGHAFTTGLSIVAEEARGDPWLRRAGAAARRTLLRHRGADAA
jgi:tight adherence protein B